MELPYTHNIKHQRNGDLLLVSIQTQTKYKPTPNQLAKYEQDGVLLDLHLYRHISTNLVTGDVVDNYLGPPDL